MCRFCVSSYVGKNNKNLISYDIVYVNLDFSDKEK